MSEKFDENSFYANKEIGKISFIKKNLNELTNDQFQDINHQIIDMMDGKNKKEKENISTLNSLSCNGSLPLRMNETCYSKKIKMSDSCIIF